MHTFLFDIDGTLIRSGGAGGNALRAAFCECFEIADVADVPFSGRTDRGIIQNLFAHHGVENSEQNWRRVCSSYLERLPAELGRCEGQVLRGVLELLETLRAREDAVLGLLTGNMAEGARIKLQHYDVYDYFAFGGYGDDHPHRDDVARSALAAAGQHLQSDVAVDRTWVIGDTPLDVTCARAIGARAVAVATGFHEKEELISAEPDVLLDDLTPFLSHISW